MLRPTQNFTIFFIDVPDGSLHDEIHLGHNFDFDSNRILLNIIISRESWDVLKPYEQIL